MDIEFMVLSTLVKGKESVTALRSIPISIGRLFIRHTKHTFSIIV